ncbi:hypothetical protein D1B31_18300 [Neobacillus notoginsengisoli]|uniref:DUF1540 domain-containing protein n=1 Tax=Neobacillus notoginsengisoli TaxID=1578198 RepID=A0A417YQN6_9BACI|nr:hypothetical protein [Neobacillus notoginsengisoli]RHW36036.1 hypothetical protein D1B31_18300 [Neobacillus notoginsengisoli]
MAHEFSCCSAFKECNYGKLECVFIETEPGKKERCRCYQINHSKINITNKEVNKKLESSIQNNSEEQLSLF